MRAYPQSRRGDMEPLSIFLSYSHKAKKLAGGGVNPYFETVCADPTSEVPAA